MQLAFLILAHDYPHNLLRLVNRLTRDGDLSVIHWDKKSAFDIEDFLRREMTDADFNNVRFAKRFDVQWGAWSMVEATLSCLEVAKNSARQFDYVILLSGADYPIRPLSHMKAFLQAHNGREFIECVDPDEKRWVIQGLSKERYEYRHWVNWRTHPKLFDWLWQKQRSLGLRRRMPDGLKAHFGSQWWALTWKTASGVLARSRVTHIRRFFRTTWVPDEMFFQTLVASIVPMGSIGYHSLTFYHFSLQGRPIVFYNDHLKFLLQQEFFFARKISPHAEVLRDGLDASMDAASHQPLPNIWPRKHIAELDCFLRLQWRGIPNTRVMGKVSDAWYGDLEWNDLPYFVILAPDEADVEALRKILNDHPKIRCYGDLFRPHRIDYALPGEEHPTYPEGDSELRDMKRPNFLCDMIQLNRKKVLGCVMRVPPHHEMVDVVIYDPRALLVLCLPDRSQDNERRWKHAHNKMTLGDRLVQIRKEGKSPIVIWLNNYAVSDNQAYFVKNQLDIFLKLNGSMKAEQG